MVAAAQVVWTGPTTTFSKLGTAPADLPANQDRLTDNVWLTRGGTGQGGMFNIAQELSFNFDMHPSPIDTEWATEVILANDGQTIAASNHSQLTFATWTVAFGGPSSMLLGNILSKNAVVHLITDNIFLDLKFTDFGPSGNFAYQRSTPAAPPPTGDYNGNGSVDAADYVLWRDTFGQSAAPAGSGADGNASGTIDDPDHEFWKARFGNPVPAVAAGTRSIAVPEPANAGMALCWILLFPGRRCRRP